PRTVAADLDHPGLVPGGVQCRDDRARRGERDLVLAGTATGEYRHADPRRHGGGGVVVVGVVSVVVVVVSNGGTYFPTNSVTTVFGSCWLLPTGSWEITMPSNVSPSVSCFVTSTLNPAAFRVAVASFCVWPVTSGSGDVCGPFDTERLTVEPFVAVDDP